jgi:RNA polymerase sigma-70 factor (ECF subfamily)
LTDKEEMQITIPDTDSVEVKPNIDIHNEVLITEAVEDSTVSSKKDSITHPVFVPEINITEELGKQKKRWQFLAAGSLGPALAQSAYKLIAVDNSRLPEPDASSVVLPDHVSTWEEYATYLNSIPYSDIPADTLALMEIADYNTGEIEQKEHHDMPITFGISLTKSLGRNWSLETGLQYSILKSRFYLGENGYSIVDKQKVHYLGIPLRVFYNWIDYKRLSAYTSAGVSLHIPVYGKVSSSYLVNWQSAYSESRHFTPSLQWQTGIGIGLQYKLAPNTSLFVEPTFNWFIPSGSDTHTIWTEHPFMFTCPFGLRITW